MPAGFVMYAPPAYVPRSMAFPTSPVSADAALLMTAHVVPAFAGGGLGRMLVQGVARDLTKRGIKAIEAFGDAKFGDAADPGRGPASHPPTSSCRWASRRSARTPAIPACGWSCGRR